MSNLRAEGFGAPGFLGVAFESAFLGNAQAMSVEKESIIMRLVFSGGLVGVG